MLKTGRIQREGSVVAGVQENLESLLWNIWCIKNLQKQIEIEKVMASQSRGQDLKKKTTKQYKAGSWTLKNSLYVALLLLKLKNDL